LGGKEPPEKPPQKGWAFEKGGYFPPREFPEGGLARFRANYKRAGLKGAGNLKSGGFL